MTSPAPRVLATLPGPTPDRPCTVWGGPPGPLLEAWRREHRQVALLHDGGLPPPLVARVSGALRPSVTVALPAGEAAKTPEVFARVLGELATAALPRTGAVFTLGGGAASDLGGFVAAAYLRGVAWYALPTTLLAMVDASVGGKTGINLPQGKNLAGAFWPPRAVLCDPDTLHSLPPDVRSEGLAEAFKHGLLADAPLLDAVLTGALHPAHPEFLPWLGRAVAVKADTVNRDPFEAGERAFLNLGHTLGHALEAASWHALEEAGWHAAEAAGRHAAEARTLPHGHAVAYGLHYAALLSEALFPTAAGLREHTRALLRHLRLPPPPAHRWEALWPYLVRDKKADGAGAEAGPRWVVLRGPGQPELARPPVDTLRAVYGEFLRDLRKEAT